MKARSSPLGSGLYFIDVLACLLFCLTLALVGARFGTEHTVEVELPEIAEGAAPGAVSDGLEIALRVREGTTELFLDGERVSFSELEANLRAAPPPGVVVRSEESELARVVAIAHAAGVMDIELAYEATTNRGEGE